MNSLNDISELLAERVGRQLDKPFKKELKDLIVVKRSRFLRNSLEKRPADKRFYLQSFHVKLKKVDRTDECSDEIPKGCDIVFKSEQEIPSPLRLGVHPFEYVGAVGGNDPFGWTTFGTVNYTKHHPYGAKNGKYTYINDYLYVFNKNLPEIRVEGIFDDPRLLAAFNKCGSDKPCYSDQDKFPVDNATLELIIKDILSNELRLLPKEEDVEIKVDKNV